MKKSIWIDSDLRKPVASDFPIWASHPDLKQITLFYRPNGKIQSFHSYKWQKANVPEVPPVPTLNDEIRDEAFARGWRGATMRIAFSVGALWGINHERLRLKEFIGKSDGGMCDTLIDVCHQLSEIQE